MPILGRMVPPPALDETARARGRRLYELLLGEISELDLGQQTALVRAFQGGVAWENVNNTVRLALCRVAQQMPKER